MRLKTKCNHQGKGSSREQIRIGGGSGSAGLRERMKERIAANQHRNWLIFGERDEQVDYLFRDEIDEWQKAGTLERLDLCFMKDGVQQKVQDVLRDKKAQLQCWLDDGATLYISGSRAHIGAGMDDTMTCLYGDGTIQRLTANNRYKKDVY